MILKLIAWYFLKILRAKKSENLIRKYSIVRKHRHLYDTNTCVPPVLTDEANKKDLLFKILNLTSLNFPAVCCGGAVCQQNSAALLLPFRFSYCD